MKEKIRSPKLILPKRKDSFTTLLSPMKRIRAKIKRKKHRCQLCGSKEGIKICINYHRICRKCRIKYRIRIKPSFDVEINCIICGELYLSSLVREDNSLDRYIE